MLDKSRGYKYHTGSKTFYEQRDENGVLRFYDINGNEIEDPTVVPQNEGKRYNSKGEEISELIPEKVDGVPEVEFVDTLEVKPKKSPGRPKKK